MSHSEQHKQFLRIRRRRASVAVVPNMLRIGGLDDRCHQESPTHFYSSMERVTLDDKTPIGNTDNNHRSASAEPKTAADVFFRRVTTQSPDQNVLSRKRRIVDAVLLNEEDIVPPSVQLTTSRKRSKIQLLVSPSSHTVNASKSRVAYAVLSPDQCRVDESLMAVFQHTKSLEDHVLEFPHDMLWVNAVGGTWLHAAVMLNEVEIIRRTFSSLDANSKATLLHAYDGEHCTPIEVARVTGHDVARQLLESYHRDDCCQTKNNDEDMYEYDLYCWDPSINSAVSSADASMVLDCELHNHCTGYFDTERGELVVEATDDFDKRYGSGPFMAECDEDDGEDEIDSNDEDWQGNDYPDEEESIGDCSSTSSISVTFRNRRVTATISYDDDYDAAYGDTYDQYDDEC